MSDTTMLSANNYTDVQGLSSIRKNIKDNPQLAKKEVAKQFESLMIQMMLKSMRDANRAISSDSSAGNHMEMYEDLFDKQLALTGAEKGFGLADVIEKSLDHAQAISNGEGVNRSAQAIEKVSKPVVDKVDEDDSPELDSPAGFVNTLWSLAKDAATILKADPKVLIAQAALESDWGKKIISHVSGATSNNLFNIKAGHAWDKEVATVDAVEESDGVARKQKSNFRAYDSLSESFKDYVHFLQSNERYREALGHAASPKQFTEALQKASFATDSNYSNKIMQIYSSKKFNALFKNLI